MAATDTKRGGRIHCGRRQPDLCLAAAATARPAGGCPIHCGRWQPDLPVTAASTARSGGGRVPRCRRRQRGAGRRCAQPLRGWRRGGRYAPSPQAAPGIRGSCTAQHADEGASLDPGCFNLRLRCATSVLADIVRTHGVLLTVQAVNSQWAWAVRCGGCHRAASQGRSRTHVSRPSAM